MKKILFLSLLCLATTAMVLAPAGAMAEAYKGKIGGGPTGGTFNTFSNAMSIFVPKQLPEVKLSAVGSGGSVENVKRVSSGESEFGLCYAVDSDLARKGLLPKDETKYDGVRVMGFLYGAPAQLVVRADSEFKSAKDLTGKKVAVGNAGSGAAASAERFFRHLGVWENFDPQFLGYSAAASAFKDGKIDAFWVLVGYPNSSIIEASTTNDIALLDVAGAAKEAGFFEKFPFYAPAAIPAGTYKGQDKEVKTFSDSALWATRVGVKADDVCVALKTVFSPEGLEHMVKAHKAAKEMTVENGVNGIPVPLHKGAEQCWAEKGKAIPDAIKSKD